MPVLIAKYQKLIEDLEKEIELQDRIIENYKAMIKNYEQKEKIMEELLKRKEEENATLAQKLDQLSASAAVDSSVEGAVCDSLLSGEGPHT